LRGEANDNRTPIIESVLQPLVRPWAVKVNLNTEDFIRVKKEAREKNVEQEIFWLFKAKRKENVA
jgi:hypothetical protein